MKFIKITLCAIFFLACNKSFTVEYGTEEEAEMMLNRAVNLMKFDEMYALEQMTEGGGGFIIKDLYPFCANSKGILVGHPVNVGFNVLDFVDSDGKNVGEEFFKIAEKNKINKVSYKLARITTDEKNELEKIALVTKVKKYICAVGFYKQ